MTDDAAAPFGGDQAVTTQNLADGSSMWPRPARMFLSQDLEQFLSSPAGMVAASLQDRCHPLSWGLIGRPPEVYGRVLPGRWGRDGGNAEPIYSRFFRLTWYRSHSSVIDSVFRR